MNLAHDYCKYYQLESYLFDEVSPKFQQTNTLSAFDFFCIVIWKANRSKSKIARRLLDHGYSELQGAVTALMQQVAAAHPPKEKLRVFLEDWSFRLPMASAILTVLYPEDFTIYDVRVCDVLGDFHNINNKASFESQWLGYTEFLAAVKNLGPENLSLRDKDRWLWGKSFVEQLHEDIKNTFSRS